MNFEQPHFEQPSKIEKSNEPNQELQEEFLKNFEQKTLDYIEKLLPSWIKSPFVGTALLLTGLDSEKAWKIREEIVGNVKGTGDAVSLAKSLAGLDSEKAWKMRKGLKEIGFSNYAQGQNVRKIGESALARGLTGLDSERAWKIREKLWREPYMKSLVSESLVGLDSERAWKMRKEAFGEATTNENIGDKCQVIRALAGLDSEEAWGMREDAMKGGDDDGRIKKAVGESLAGLDSERAWKIREELFANKEKGIVYEGIARGLAGLDSERAWKMRKELFNQATNKDVLAESLAGLDSERAWKAREGLLKDGDGVSKESLVRGLTGDFITSVVWRLKLKEKQAKEVG